MKNLRGVLQLFALFFLFLAAVMNVQSYLKNRLTVPQYGNVVCQKIIPQVFLEEMPTSRGFFWELEDGLERMDAVTPPLILWGYHRALTGFLHEIYDGFAAALSKKNPSIVELLELIDLTRYENELQSVGLWYRLLPRSTRRVLDMGDCPTGL